MTTKTFLLALLCLVGASSTMVEAKTYDLEVDLLMVDDKGCGPADSASISELIATTFASVGVAEAGNSGKWKVGKNGKDQYGGQDIPGDGFRGRDLQWLSCQQAAILCQLGAYWYCSNCCGCSNGRRRLRSKLSKEEIEDKTLAQMELALVDMDISCLAKGDDAAVKVMVYER